MNLTTKEIVAIHVMDTVAHASGPVLLETLAAGIGRKPGYVQQITFKLVTAGLLGNVRGIGGGYVLTRPAKAIKLPEILSAVAGPYMGQADDWTDRMVQINERFRGWMEPLTKRTALDLSS